jgi:hypothetical protein
MVSTVFPVFVFFRKRCCITETFRLNTQLSERIYHTQLSGLHFEELAYLSRKSKIVVLWSGYFCFISWVICWRLIPFHIWGSWGKSTWNPAILQALIFSLVSSLAMFFWFLNQSKNKWSTWNQWVECGRSQMILILAAITISINCSRLWELWLFKIIQREDLNLRIACEIVCRKHAK